MMCCRIGTPRRTFGATSLTKNPILQRRYNMGSGATERSRTADLCLTKALLYQLSYSGKLCDFMERSWLPSSAGSQVPAPHSPYLVGRRGELQWRFVVH